MELTQGCDFGSGIRTHAPVSDCTVPEAHFQTALMAFGQGIGVLGEKPLADTLPNARQMIQTVCVQSILPRNRFCLLLQVGSTGIASLIDRNPYEFTEAELPPADPADQTGGHRGLVGAAVNSL
jgi:hypothetical protein